MHSKKLRCRNIAEAVLKGVKFLEITPFEFEEGEGATLA
jgi:hypothetical protein